MLNMLYEIFGEALAYAIIVGIMIIFGILGTAFEAVSDWLKNRKAETR